MKPTLTLSLLAATLALGACSARDCGAGADYLSATSAPRFVVPEGVRLGPASPAYAIPDGGQGELALRRDDAQPADDRRATCIYEPPRLPPEEDSAPVDAESDAEA